MIKVAVFDVKDNSIHTFVDVKRAADYLGLTLFKLNRIIERGGAQRKGVFISGKVYEHKSRRGGGSNYLVKKELKINAHEETFSDADV